MPTRTVAVCTLSHGLFPSLALKNHKLCEENDFLSREECARGVCVCVCVCVCAHLFFTSILTSLPLQRLRDFLMTFRVQLSCDPSIIKVKTKVLHTRRATAGLFNWCFPALPEGHFGCIPLSAEQTHPAEITYLSFLNGYPNFTDSSWHHLVKQPHSSSFSLPSFTPLWTSEHCDKHLNGCICSLLPSTTSWILNGSCLIYRCRMSGILQKTLRASRSLSVEGERQRLIWNSLYQSAHARISAIQQVIRNAKKTWGEWEYLRGKVTLGPPSVTAYAQCAPVCMGNRHECRCIVICYCSFHSHTCFLVSSDTSYSLITSKRSFLKHDWKCYLIALFSNYFTNRGGMWVQLLTSLLFEEKQREWHPLVHPEHAAKIYLTITQNQTAEKNISYNLVLVQLAGLETLGALNEHWLDWCVFYLNSNFNSLSPESVTIHLKLGLVPLFKSLFLFFCKKTKKQKNTVKIKIGT